MAEGQSDISLKPAKRIAGGGPESLVLLIIMGDDNICFAESIDGVGKPEFSFGNGGFLEDVDNLGRDDETGSLDDVGWGFIGGKFFF